MIARKVKGKDQVIIDCNQAEAEKLSAGLGVLFRNEEPMLEMYDEAGLELGRKMESALGDMVCITEAGAGMRNTS